MPHMTLTRMPSRERVVLTFTEATEFNIDNGAEGATILALYLSALLDGLHAIGDY